MSSYHSPITVPRTAIRPIIVIGAGEIVRVAHLPAYRIAGFPVAGIYDIDSAKARTLASQFGIPRVFESLKTVIKEAPDGAIFDVAVPGAALLGIVKALPDGAGVLLQKPLGENLAQARVLLQMCRRKRLKAAVNFQMRYSPQVVAARALIARGAIGDLHDMEFRLTVNTPWGQFLKGVPRVEILYHSIHYVDLIRSFFGEPRGVYAKTLTHPRAPEFAATRTTIVLDYGPKLRANITANHGHAFGPRHRECYVKWEGTQGAIKAQLGLILNYPLGDDDTLEICQLARNGRPAKWRHVPFHGSWVPHAFIGTMASVMRYAARLGPPATRVEDAFRTMAVVEAAYQSSATGATPISSR